MSRDEREWILRWDYRQKRHYIDGPTHGEFEGIVVVPKTALEAEREKLRRERDEAKARTTESIDRATRCKNEALQADERTEQAEAQRDEAQDDREVMKRAWERVDAQLEQTSERIAELERINEFELQEDLARVQVQRDALAEALRELVRLKGEKSQREADVGLKGANHAYQQEKEAAWKAARQVLAALEANHDR